MNKRGLSRMLSVLLLVVMVVSGERLCGQRSHLDKG